MYLKTRLASFIFLSKGKQKCNNHVSHLSQVQGTMRLASGFKVAVEQLSLLNKRYFSTKVFYEMFGTAEGNDYFINWPN